MPEGAPPPGSPQEARAVFIAVISEMRALNEALKVHSVLLEKHAQLVTGDRSCPSCGGVTEASPGGVASLLSHLQNAINGFVEPDPPPPRRRRR